MAAEPPVLPGAEEARRWAAEELAQPEYREAAPGWLQTLWDDFLDWMASLDPSGTPDTSVPGIAIAVVIAVIIAAAVIVAKPRLNAKAKQGHEVFEPDLVLTPAAYRQRAEASAAAGKWGDAVVDRFRALVRSAEERTVLDPQPGRTADEVSRDLAVPFRAEAQRLGHAAATFDAIRYGNWAAGAGDYQEMASLDSALDSLKPARSPQGEDMQQDAPAGSPAVLP